MKLQERGNPPLASGTCFILCPEQLVHIFPIFGGIWHRVLCHLAGLRHMASAAHCAAGPGAPEARAELLTTGQDRRAAHAGRGRAAPPFS